MIRFFPPTVFLIVPFKLYLTQSVNGNRSYSINFSDVQFLIWEKFLWSPPVLIHYEIWGLRSVSTAGWKKTTQHSGQRTREKRYNWVTEGRLGANILINIGLSSSLSPSLSLYLQTFYTIRGLRVQILEKFEGFQNLCKHNLSRGFIYKTNNKISDRDNRTK